ncbi:MAG: DUF2949 domain-containing protein [Acaryochloridaceae cyanobacterium SU_2_1]|nr:DUF2949 domain-containing protein [Acaryochloridaceae cyanobacterium SU_2_1]
MNASPSDKLVQFLQEELLVPADAIALGIRQQQHLSGSLPIALWSYGFITLNQLNRLFDWLEMA